MNQFLLRPEVQQYISNFDGNIIQLALKGSPWEEIPVRELIHQIESQNKCEEKLPTWYAAKNIYYPPKLHIEQTSSEITAKYKASLIEGESLADITGGFGVDSFYFSERIPEVHHFEQNQSLSEITKHNFQQLGKKNVSFFSDDGVAGIRNKEYDVIYVDPSRRHSTKGKVFFLKDCEPNLVEQQEYLLERCTTLMVKTSPMLDIAVGLKELKNVSEIHIVAVNNEVKELLWLLSKSGTDNTIIKTIHFTKDIVEKFEFPYHSNSDVNYATPLTYLYEPNAAIMKSGGFSEICEAYSVLKLAQHSHLYTSDSLVDFPGRIFKIDKVIPYQKSTMKELINTKANVSTRNFSETVVQLKKKWKLKDGGDSYLFFTTLSNGEKVVLKSYKV